MVESRGKKGEQLLIGYAHNDDIKALFELLGMTAVAHGPVSKHAIEEIECFMSGQLSPHQRDFAISCFRAGKALPQVKGAYTKRAFQLFGFRPTSDVERWLEPMQVLEILLRVALADGKFSAEEEYIIDSVRATLGVHSRTYWILRNTIAERFDVLIDSDLNFHTSLKQDGHRASSYKAKPHDGAQAKGPQRKRAVRFTKGEALGLLQLSDTAALPELKSSYRKLVKRYHPDALKSTQISDAEMKDAIAHFCRIQEAYEFLIEEIKA